MVVGGWGGGMHVFVWVVCICCKLVWFMQVTGMCVGCVHVCVDCVCLCLHMWVMCRL